MSIKLLAILFLIKSYARNKIFKFIFIFTMNFRNSVIFCKCSINPPTHTLSLNNQHILEAQKRYEILHSFELHYPLISAFQIECYLKKTFGLFFVGLRCIKKLHNIHNQKLLGNFRIVENMHF